MTKDPVKKGDEMTGETPNQSTCDTLCKPLVDLADELDRLKNELRERQLIERAKGVLIKSKGVSEQEAAEMLQSFTVQQNKSLAEAANIVLLGEKMLGKGLDK